ncbi:acyl-CoA dehydrogenase [Penicillium cf. viridicatum]|uniref:Acyl-CoA dehydrogenase n=1 Tax=Penicillium cf. viridicatum TaxID=2972119 RepID=A0A9W9ML56_9EURO|nr:acyl-CoA dehydrogenase [Penicillium cf. viridicatum]
MVDFSLSKSEARVQYVARKFAVETLTAARSIYSTHEIYAKRFQVTRPFYKKAVLAGIIKAQIPTDLGGTSTNLVEIAILAEELYAIDPSVSLTILGTGLGLTPIILAYRPELEEFLKPFLLQDGDPLASLVFTEPEGCANWLEDGAPGLQTIAYREGEDWILNGEKTWATNCAGWDFNGADLQCVVCRCTEKDVMAKATCPEDLIMILLVTPLDIERSPGGSFQVLRHQQALGHTGVSGPHVKYTNLRLPAKNLLCPPGSGAAIVSASFGMSAALVGAMSTGIQRAIFNAALDFCKRETRGGTAAIGNHQSVADLLMNIKMRTEASSTRYLTWKATHSMSKSSSGQMDSLELAMEAKIFCSEAAVKSALDAINAVGVSSYDTSLPFSGLLNDALVLPIFDGGNIGVRRRTLQRLLMAKGYDAWATIGTASSDPCVD